jgi:hypothetical protein
MEDKILKHYLEFSTFTNPGYYKTFLQSLPDDIGEIGNLVCHQIIHRVILKNGNTGANSDLRYGDMNLFPWYRLRCEDDILPNAVSMIAELLRLDDSGFTPNRKVENKIIITCRYAAILMASILKSKNIPCRVRSGFAPYLVPELSVDHWINQYWNKTEQKWITIDADGFYNSGIGFDQYNMPYEKFDWAAETWLGLRKGILDEKKYFNAGGFTGFMPALWALFYDFHSLMNNEILYLQGPNYLPFEFEKLTDKDLKEVDELAKLLLDPDNNYNELLRIWTTEKKYRILNGPLINSSDHVIWK